MKLLKSLHCMTVTFWRDWKIYTNAMSWALAMWDLNQWLRERIKYHDEPYDDVRDKLFDILDHYGISMDDIE